MMNNTEQDYKTNMIRNMYSCINNLRENYKKKERFLRQEDSTLIITDVELDKK